jgi:uncharacterized protein (TIGR04255 family)
MKPNEYESLIADINKLGQDFQHFEVLNPTQIKFEGPNVSILKGENAGFKFTGFDKGKPEKILRGINEENRFYYSFHLFNYKNWNLFKGDFLRFISILDKFQPGAFVQAYSLTYLDEFTWDQIPEMSDGYETNKIFNENSDFLPKNFFGSNNVSYTIDADKSEGIKKYSDRLDITITDKMLGKNIGISHNQTFFLPEVTRLVSLIEDDRFRENMDEAHRINKDLLKNILTKEVLEKINLV